MMRGIRMIAFGMMIFLAMTKLSYGQETEPDLKLLPPLPMPASESEGESSLLPSQEPMLEALSEEELEQIFQPVDLSLKKSNQFTIRTQLNVYLDVDDPSRGMIEPPPMQANPFDAGSEPVSLQDYTGNGVEFPYYTPVAPFCYPPLYFEDPCLERYGDAYCEPFQSVVSGARFYLQIPMLSINMFKEPPCKKSYNIWTHTVDEARE